VVILAGFTTGSGLALVSAEAVGQPDSGRSEAEHRAKRVKYSAIGVFSTGQRSKVNFGLEKK